MSSLINGHFHKMTLVQDYVIALFVTPYFTNIISLSNCYMRIILYALQKGIQKNASFLNCLTNNFWNYNLNTNRLRRWFKRNATCSSWAHRKFLIKISQSFVWSNKLSCNPNQMQLIREKELEIKFCFAQVSIKGGPDIFIHDGSPALLDCVVSEGGYQK